MFGSIFYNLWAALIAFTIYFLITLQKPYLPIRIIIGSFIAAIIVFFATFLVRYLVSYILYTPEVEENSVEDELNEATQEDDDLEENKEKQGNNSTVEFQDENTEEIAQVVRTMMSREETQQVN